MKKGFLSNVGSYVLMLKHSVGKPENRKVYWREFMSQCNDIGLGSLPIVLMVSAFLGMVMTVQTAYMLVSPLVPKSVIASIVRDSTILELSPTVISIVLAGVVGSRVSSAMGNMRVSEQIDALDIMGINSRTYLIMPKITAALLMIPCLIICSIFMSLIGGLIAGTFSGAVAYEQYVQGLVNGFNSYNLSVAFVKVIAFSFLITSIATFYGYNVEGGSLEIGRASTKSVIVSCIAILIADYIITVLML